MRTPLAIEVEFWNLVPDHTPTHHSTSLCRTADRRLSTGSGLKPSGMVVLIQQVCFPQCMRIPGSFLNSGTHRILLLVVENGDTVIYRHEDILSFDVHDLDKRPGHWLGKEPGVL